MRTVWVMGDQLNRDLGAMARARPDDHRVLIVESRSMVEGRRFHRQRLHLVLTAMRRFAAELDDAGYDVDFRRADTMRAGFDDHVSEFEPEAVIATEPNARGMLDLMNDLGVEIVRSDQFLCHREDFAEWADGRDSLLMEDFYRWQRKRLGYLMDGDEPAGGRWNFDHDNREPPPADGGDWPAPQQSRLDDLDQGVLEDLPDGTVGADPVGWWATSRRAALSRLNHFVSDVLPRFGPTEDAMMRNDWHLAHSLLSPYLNLGLLHPSEVCDRVEEEYRSGRVPINSAEGFIRQVIGWREFVWGISWLWPEQADANVFEAERDVPGAWRFEETTDMTCLSHTLEGLYDRGWIHHIQRLMILSNLGNLLGIDPRRVREWMRDVYVDGGNWVMGPNVMGMGMWADGGRMATKPYVSGGAYVNRMSDYCSECVYDPKKRVGDDACPFTTLYWDFLDRHRSLLESNHRMARQYSTLDRLSDLDEVRDRARQMIERHG